jgi:hypothetical protein
MDALVICGHHRSGTTLLRALLDGHPEIAAFPLESELIRDGLRPGATRPTATSLVDALIERAHGHEFTAELDTDRFAARLRERLRAAPDPIGLTRLTGLVVESYADVTGQADARYWADKTPRVEGDLVDVLVEAPEVKALYLVRDPRDVLASSMLRSQRRGAEHGGTPSFVRAWSASLGSWEGFREAGGDGLLVRYEDLCAAPRATMERVAAFLGVAWDDVMLVPSRGGAPWESNTSHGQRSSAIDQASVGRWRTSLDPADARLVEVACAPAMLRLGCTATRPGVLDLTRAMARRGGVKVAMAVAQLGLPVSTSRLRGRWRARRRGSAATRCYVRRG